MNTVPANRIDPITVEVIGSTVDPHCRQQSSSLQISF